MTGTEETEAFGRYIGGTGSTSSPFGYHGSEGYRQDGDGPAGLEPYQKVGARYCDATFGRFLTRDTDLSQAPYAYCDGDPVNCSDPSGHGIWHSVFIIAGGVVGAIVGAGLIITLGPLGAEADVILYSAIIGATPSLFIGELGNVAGDQVDKENEHNSGGEPPDRPKKGGGGVSAGDSTITEGEKGESGSGNYSTPVPTTTYQDEHEDGTPIGAPYTVPSGTPGHYPYRSW